MQNNLLSEQLIYTGENAESTHLHICRFNKCEVNMNSGTSWNDIKGYFSEDSINLIQIHGLKNIKTVEEVCDHFGISVLIQQDILNINHPPKIEQYDNYNFIVSKICMEDAEGEPVLIHTCIIQGANYIITFAESDTDLFENVMKAINENVFKIRQRQSDYLLSVLLNSIITGYVSLVNKINDDLDDIEERLLSLENNEVNIADIQKYRHKYLSIKKGILPLKEHYNKLFYGDSPLIHKNNKAFFNDVNDHLQLAVQLLDNSHESLSSLIDLYISNNDLHMNNIMKRLTIVSTIFIPLTFLAGIWGMNFSQMPELNWKYGYLMAWGVMIVTGVLIYFFFKRKKWY